MSNKTDSPDSHRAAFRKYLEDNGVIKQLSRVLVGLYEEQERPLNALDYIKRYLGAPTGVDMEALRGEVQSLSKENASLKARVEALQQQVEALRKELEE